MYGHYDNGALSHTRTVQITDAYAHCGLRKYKPVEALRAIMKDNGVSRTVVVQHRGEYDHSYIEAIVRAEPSVFAGVFLVDLDSPRAMDEVTKWTERGIFRGIRLPAPSLSTHRPLWVWAAQLKLNFIVDERPLEHAAPLAAFAKEFPRTPITFTHLAQPDPQKPAIPALKLLAASPNVHVQVSGMHSAGKPPYSNLVPWITALLEHLGPKRLLYGSNYPVMREDSVYREEIGLTRTGKLGIPLDAASTVMNDNAVRLWFGPRA
jgi:L-fuconolactonase